MSRTATLVVALLAVLGLPSALGADHGIPEAAPAIEVTGSGEVVVNADRATLTIAVETQGMTSAAAAAENARLTAAVTDALLTAGARRPDVATSSYSVLPQWQYPGKGPPRRVGYQADNTLRISVNQLAVLGPWMDAALGAGASRIESVGFAYGGAASARLEALAKAVANARSEAETLARAAGGRLGPLQRLTTAPAAGPRPLLQEAPVAAARGDGYQTHLEPSPLHINAVVTARWRFEP